mmetsp:Transcript_4888/g.12548  ORF Transcript_4888/g.12548 Transcript_4888/m.12548 type:complete len:856 (-) Transcript_4888:151-2718(-)
MDVSAARVVLGVDGAAAWPAIRLAYKKLALKLHPDKNPGDAEAADRFADLRAAYDMLEKQHVSGERQQHEQETTAEKEAATRWREESMKARATVNEAQRAAEEAARLAMFVVQRKRARANAVPPKPLITGVDESSVTVSWFPPDVHLFGEALNYELQFCLVRCPDGPQSAWAYVWQTASDKLPQRTARKKNLTAGHAYVFRVRAQAEDGLWSQFSEPCSPGEPGVPPEDFADPATSRPLPLQARVGPQPCQLIAQRIRVEAHRGGSGAWQLQYRALRGLWTATGAGDEAAPSLELDSDVHALDGLHERAQYCLRARVQILPMDVWSVWTEEAGPFGVRQPEGTKPRQTGFMRSISKAVLAAGLRSSAKPLGELGDKIFADGSAYTGPLVNGLAHGDGELKLASGAVCAGHFELDVLHGGEGKMVEPDHATSYVGQWQRGARHGQGTQGWHTGPFHNYIGEWEEGMFSGQGTLTMRTGETYSGGWAAGLRSGPGEAKVPDTGEWYKGGWERNAYSGKGHGRFIYPDGTIYEGETVSGGRQGEGQLIAPIAVQNEVEVPGWTYKGQFDQGEVSGKGLMTFSDGREHKGLFEEGRKHGKGKFTWPNGDYTAGTWEKGALIGDSKSRVTYGNGDVYEGGMRAGSQQGQGMYTRASGHVYSGAWMAGTRQGQGKSTSPNGDWYDGNWERDENKGKGKARRSLPWGVYEGATESGQFTGKGVFNWNDGRKYEGEWSYGVQQGYGTFSDVDGEKYTGNFEKGSFNGQGKVSSPDGDYFHGEFTSGERTGKGKARITYASGDVYEGDVVGSVRAGYGTYTWAGTLDKFSGNWVADKMHGKGKLKKSTGVLQEGTWNRGDFTNL